MIEIRPHGLRQRLRYAWHFLRGRSVIVRVFPTTPMTACHWRLVP